MKLYRLALAGVIPFIVVACGGGSSSPPPPATYTIGGTVSGLAGSGLVLENNGANNLAIGTNGPFTFQASVSSGGVYSVAVLAQPTNPIQTCSVANGSGVAMANVTDIQVTCASATIWYSVGGTVSGLSGSGLVLQDNGGDDLAVSGNGSFTFDTRVASGSAYSVTVLSNPSGPAQLCAVTNGSGTAAANVTNVQVACSTVATSPGQWTWMGGSSTPNAVGIYGASGAPSAGNMPGGRVWACSWTDLAGNFWLFGGWGIAQANNAQGELGDLWEYSNGQWAWMGGPNEAVGGSNGDNPLLPGIYGTMGVPDPGNQPGARDSATCWADAGGNFWLYGGEGFDSTATAGQLADLWRYSSGEWTWMAGSDIAACFASGCPWQGAATFGTEGVPSPTNSPGVRQLASGWADPSGNLWLFGGLGVIPPQGSNPDAGNMTDVWKYGNGEWTWMAGLNLVDQFGIYGTLGVSAPGNTPSSRDGAAAWTDTAGNFWLFGGNGVGAATADGGCVTPPVCLINDLWEFSPSLNQWTWMGGPDEAGEPGVYGTQGVAAPGNLPPPRYRATTWTDSQGNFWLFGGLAIAGYNDLWKYSGGEWTWESGSSQPCDAGVYGNLGTASPANVPGEREGAVGWVDKSGNLWLFGGSVGNCAGWQSTTRFNDLWEYTP